MSKNKMKFVVAFLIVATLLFSTFVVAQQAQVRRMPVVTDKRGQLSISDEPSFSPRLQPGTRSITSEPEYKPRGIKTVERHGVIIPDFKPNPSVVAKARASTNAVFKRAGVVTQNKVNERTIADPLFKPTEKDAKRIVDPSFKPATSSKSLIDPTFKPTNRARFMQMPTKKTMMQKSVNENK